MSDKISQELINQVIEKTDIIEIVSSYIQVQKKGQNYQAICPFHKDKNPSMVISPQKKFYKCFSCNESGNVINFVKNYENINFVEAFKKLAIKANLDIGSLNNYESKPKYSKAESNIFQINSIASKFFAAVLNNEVGNVAKEYLRKRQINEEEQKKWEIGFAFKNSGLKDFLLGEGFEEKDILESGLFKIYDNQIKDVFVNRLMFPIKNEDGYIIGFSGRVISPNDNPKYLNTSETKVFKKSELAFNFDKAKFEAKRADEIIILEGFMDVISLERVGILNSVAIMGTSLSAFHINLFKKITRNFNLFLDGDEPGVKAAIKAGNQLLDADINVKIISNDTNMDPDELIQKFGLNKIEQLISSAKHPIDFVTNHFSKKLNLDSQIDLENFLKEVKTVFNHLKGEIFQLKAIDNISKILNIDEEVVKKNLLPSNFKTAEPRPIIKPNVNQQKIINQKTVKEKLKSYELAEKSIIFFLIHNSNKNEFLKDNVNLMTDVQKKELVFKIIDLYEKNVLEVNQPQKIRQHLLEENENLVDTFDNVLNETKYFYLKESSLKRLLGDALSLLESKKIEDKNRHYLKKMEEATDLEIKEKYNSIIEKNYAEVIKLRKKREKK